MTENTPTSHLRGPSEHNVRDQIVEAATEHFAHYGYEKTTVSDLAKSIGFSKAYIYKFFGSKQSIGEVICANRLAIIMQRVDLSLSEASSAADKLRRLFRTLAVTGRELFFNDRKLYDIAAVAARDNWPSAQRHDEHLRQLILKILQEGRESGEFERKTPIDDAACAAYLVILPYMNPVQLQYNLDIAEEAAVQLAALVLRSLTPQ